MNTESSVSTESNFLGLAGIDPNHEQFPISPASIFRALSDAELEELGSFVSVRRARRHELVFREGEPLSHLYLVQSGSFKLVRHSHQGGGTDSHQAEPPPKCLFDRSPVHRHEI